LAFHQPAANQLRGDDLGGAGEEALGEMLGGRGGYGSGFSQTKGLRVKSKNCPHPHSYIKENQQRFPQPQVKNF